MTNIKDKPGGRPAKKRIEKQQRVVSTKLTELQYYAIRKRAGEAGLRVSEYVRQAVVSAEVIPRLNRQDADTIRKLAGEANNINQLAHRANAGGFALVAVELVKLKNRIVEIINAGVTFIFVLPALTAFQFVTAKFKLTFNARSKSTRLNSSHITRSRMPSSA